ncbi:phosphoribosylaminoimidazole carboxylase [Clavulina sp. PMI_390]|nr:phosphoribosylaminoimidazole carboxylase [Clavulina sp. PMI_390]
MDKRIGVLGGGQLGRMMGAAASLLNLDMTVLDVGDHGPAKQILSRPSTSSLPPHIDGSFADPEKIDELARRVDVLTVEIEHVDASVLQRIADDSSLKLEIHPSPQTITIIQDKYRQKEHLTAHGLPVADYVSVESSTEGVQAAISQFGLPLMLKSRTMAYDGRGNYVVRTADDVPNALAALGNRPLYAERWAPFVKEVAVMVVRSSTGEVLSYPAVETVHKDNICHLVIAPLRHPLPSVAIEARKIAEKAVATFSGAGVFGVELFLMPDGSLLINEIAPRPHNSGHYTIEACQTSQYENHLRAILGLPLGSTAMKVPSSIMLNLIGSSDSMEPIQQVVQVALTIPGASTHLYGKKECRKGRKMGHITLVGKSDAEVHAHLRPLLEVLPGETPASISLYSPLPPSGKSHPCPLVGIIMGSDSDLPTMLPGARILDSFGIPYELTIVSAHRTPDRMVEYARQAASRGLKAIIAGAGGAAHLPGMVASETALPVIGVPVKGSSLDGVDSLYSIVQMPRGIPVATMAINNSTNAALLAVRILGTTDDAIRVAVEQYSSKLEEEVLGKVKKLEEIGWEEYATKMKK